MKTLFLFIILSISICSQAQDILPRSSQFITDNEDVFSAKEEKKLIKLLQKASKIKSDNITLLTVADYGTFENIEKYAYAVSNAWDLGNNGILIIFSKSKRNIRIETSKQVWDRLTDEELKSIIDNYIIPRFKENKYFDGIKDGLSKISEELK